MLLKMDGVQINGERSSFNRVLFFCGSYLGFQAAPTMRTDAIKSVARPPSLDQVPNRVGHVRKKGRTVTHAGCVCWWRMPPPPSGAEAPLLCASSIVDRRILSSSRQPALLGMRFMKINLPTSTRCGLARIVHI